MSAAPQAGRILVTGGSGQLATALELAAPDRVHRVGRPAFDFDKPETVAACFATAAPTLVINTAAWTAVDLAETNEAAAARANADGPALLARLCEAAAIPLIQVSTDYVFDGLKGHPYTETDPASPTGVYGRTKLAGEQAVLSACRRAVVARTSWVYSATGKNFVRTMLAAGEHPALRPVLRVVGDQHGCPTAADDLAAALLSVACRLATGWQDAFRGVVHVAGSGATTWHGLAEAVFAEVARHGRPIPKLQAIATEEWPTPARRPPDSRLDCRRLTEIFSTSLPDWQSGVVRVVDRLLAGAPPASPGAASAG